jgi:hypothetical protein
MYKKFKTFWTVVGVLVALILLTVIYLKASDSGLKFFWSDYDLPQNQNVTFSATCNYTGVWFEEWHIRWVLLKFCNAI